MARTRTPAPEPEPEPEPEAQPTTAVTVSPQVTAFRRVEAALNARSDALMAVLPGKVGVDRFVRVALGAMSRQPRLFDCTTESLVKSMLDAAELGLEPSGLMGQAYLVPFRNRRSNQYEATLIIGYRGLAELARRSGQVATVEARAVRQRDVFQVSYGTSPSITHVPYLPGLMGAPAPGSEGAPDDGAGPFLAAYAVLGLKDGTTVIDVMTAAEVDAIRRRSRSSDDGPWVTDYLEMARKTVLRRALKYAPVSIVDLRVAEALDTEDRAQFGPSPDPVQGAIQAGTQPVATITAAAQAFRQGASGDAHTHQPIVSDTCDTCTAMAHAARQAAQDAPGQAEAFPEALTATMAPDDDPGPSTAGNQFTPSPAIGVTMTGSMTGRAGPARRPGETDDDIRARVLSSDRLTHPTDAADPTEEWVAEAHAHADDPPTWSPADNPDLDPATGEVRVAPDDTRLVACEDPSPYGDGAVCLMPKGHHGAHRSQQGTW